MKGPNEEWTGGSGAGGRTQRERSLGETHHWWKSPKTTCSTFTRWRVQGFGCPPTAMETIINVFNDDRAYRFLVECPLELVLLSFRADVQRTTQCDSGTAGGMDHIRTYRHEGKIHWAPQGHLAVILHPCSSYDARPRDLMVRYRL